MKYALIDQNGVVLQTQMRPKDGFIEVEEDVENGYVRLEGGDFMPPAVVISKDDYKKMIDLAAGQARARFVAEGWEVVEEYRLAQKEVEEWREAGSPAENIPLSISTWATAQGMTNEQAALGIEAAAANFKSLLLSIRAIRLTGKGALDQATENFGDIAQPFIDQLNAITP